MIGRKNLAPERGPSVWEGGGQPVGREPWLEGIGGAALAVTGIALATVGGSMLLRASRTGRRRDADRSSGATGELPPAPDRLVDEVGRESAESFPASDVPSWTPTTGIAPKS